MNSFAELYLQKQISIRKSKGNINKTVALRHIFYSHRPLMYRMITCRSRYMCTPVSFIKTSTEHRRILLHELLQNIREICYSLGVSLSASAHTTAVDTLFFPINHLYHSQPLPKNRVAPSYAERISL
jgi:hypothetical protein